MFVAVNGFAGMNKKLAAQRIADQQATEAVNCRIEDGDLVPLRTDSAAVAALPKPGVIRTLHRFADQFWFHWSEVVDVVRGPVPGDAEERTYFTGDGLPQMTTASIATAGSSAAYPSNSYRWGVPPPAVAPWVALSGQPDEDADLPERRVYVYTFVSALGEEGPPGPPSAAVDWLLGQAVELSALAPVPGGNYNINRRRIYRTGAMGDYQLVAEIDAAATSYRDEVDSENLGAVLTSLDYDPPPEDLHSIVAMPNGMLAGLAGNRLCFSEPGLPHAWPIPYRQTLMSEGVALGVFGNSVVALTQGKPEIATGVDPRGMAMTRPDTLLSCVAKRGVVEMGSVVLYPSTDGLVAIGAGEPRLITEALLKREDWQALNPASMHAYRYKGSYLCFYDTGTKRGALLVDPTGAGLTFVDLYATAGWVEPQGEGALYLVIDHTVVRFDAGETVRDSRWRSKLWVFPRPVNLVVGKLEAEAYPVRLRVWLDGVLRMDRDVGQRQFNLPTPSRGERVQLELSGGNRVRSVALAESIEELRQL